MKKDYATTSKKTAAKVVHNTKSEIVHGQGLKVDPYTIVNLKRCGNAAYLVLRKCPDGRHYIVAPVLLKGYHRKMEYKPQDNSFKVSSEMIIL